MKHHFSFNCYNSSGVFQMTCTQLGKGKTKTEAKKNAASRIKKTFLRITKTILVHDFAP